MSSIAIQPWLIPPFPPPGQTAPIRSVPDEIPSASRWSLSRSKRALDFSIALLVLVLLAFPMLVIAICVLLSSKGPALFVQKRVGRGGHLFGIYKFRSMTSCIDAGAGHTRGGDRRITAFGRLIRKFKLDELPQFYNVLRGEMSLVGPRPKLPLHEPVPDMPYRPGITGAATLAFRHEEHILSRIHANLVDHFYDNQIKPLKAQIDLHYMSQATFWSDIRTMAATFLACLAPAATHNPFSRREDECGTDSMTA
jgi:lipopolysaccharide/colanic/teichoic acid biosynthesis glycosyltransferase